MPNNMQHAEWEKKYNFILKDLNLAQNLMGLSLSTDSDANWLSAFCAILLTDTQQAQQR